MDFVKRARELGLKGIKTRLYVLTVGIFVASYLTGYVPDALKEPLTGIILIVFVGFMLYYVFLYQLCKTTN